ncbi:hypothetical protein JCM19239_3923 [Vibrio variabilis]|uniref:Uncharacterized protein n=1 Tax=Vibrio variabilis TaxID=990271 RepID=A0ABQ0J643_9VIBR|nr:hypothetical protein JCM19239_3923 [Vibrio variabilis]
MIVNGNVLATLNANRFEQQYMKKGLHPTGRCGFELDLKELGVKPSDFLQVKVKGDVVNLHKEPLSFEDLTDWLSPEAENSLIESKVIVNMNLVKSGILRGWARTNDNNVPAVVGIYINGSIFAQVPAVIYREHLRKPEIHPSGHCGFEFNLKQHGVTPQDRIDVKLVNAKSRYDLKSITFPQFNDWLTHQELQQLNRKVNNEAS